MKRLIFGVLFAQFLFSCNNDLDIYSEKTDLPYVYGSITSNQTEHVVKVTKTFQKLGQDVLPEDLYYHDDSIQVYIDEYNGSNLINSHLATPVSSNDKVEGLFPSPTNKYYKVSNTLFSTSANLAYSIRVEMPDGGVVKNLKNFKLQNVIALKRPLLSSPTAIVEIDFVGNSGELAPYVFDWTQEGGAREQGILNVAIQETNTATNTIDTVYVPISVYNDIPNNKNVNAQFHLSDLIQSLADKLESNPNIRRRMLRTEIGTLGAAKVIRGYGVGFEVWSESKDLTSYETVLFSSTGISEDKPNFTNLSDAVGMFSTRSTKAIDIESEKLFFGERTLDSLACSPKFFEYNFAKSYIDQFGFLQLDDSPQRCN